MTRILLALAACAALYAQQNLVSPEIAPDSRVTFRVAAPKAAEVLFYGDWMPTGKTLPMSKDANGVWSITTAPLPPASTSTTSSSTASPLPTPSTPA